ncbi:MAG: hypothetical protein ACM3WS_07005 [Bacillota bacterium]
MNFFIDRLLVHIGEMLRKRQALILSREKPRAMRQCSTVRQYRKVN